MYSEKHAFPVAVGPESLSVSSPFRSRQMKPASFFGLILLSLAAFAGGWYARTINPEMSFLETPSPLVESTPAAPQKVVAQGRIVPRGGIVNIIGSPGQRIESILVTEGDTVVEQETELAIISGLAAYQIQAELSEAQAADARRELEQKVLAAENNVLSANNALQLAELQLTETQSALDVSVATKQLAAAKEKIERLQSLSSDPQTQRYIATSQLSDQQLSIEQAQSQLDLATRQQQAALQAAELNVELAQKTVAAAESSLDALRQVQSENRTAELSQKLANQQVSLAQIIAPINGTVLKIHSKPGESITNLPLMQIGDLSQIECLAEVVDRLVPSLTIGQTVSISSPALPHKISGRVTHIGRMVGPGTLMDPSPLALVDRKTVEVRIAVDPASADVAKRLINLQVAVEIDIDSTLQKLPPDGTPPTASGSDEE